MTNLFKRKFNHTPISSLNDQVLGTLLYFCAYVSCDVCFIWIATSLIGKLFCTYMQEPFMNNKDWNRLGFNRGSFLSDLHYNAAFVYIKLEWTSNFWQVAVLARYCAGTEFFWYSSCRKFQKLYLLQIRWCKWLSLTAVKFWNVVANEENSLQEWWRKLLP